MAKKTRAGRRDRAGAPAASTGPSPATPAPDERARAAGPSPVPAPAVRSRLESLLASRWVLPAVLVLAAVLRFAHVSALASTPFFDHLGLDPLVYDEWGQRIAAGDWLGNRIYYQDPLYPYFLGVLYSLFGRDLMLLYTVQVGFGVATCALVAMLGRRVFDAATGNLAALMTALFLPSIFYEVQVEKTFLSVFLVAAFLVLALDRTAARRAAAGFVLAAASLTRANLILFIPLGVAAMLFERDAAAGRRGVAAPRFDFTAWPGRAALRRAAAFLGGCALVLAPVAIRNYAVEGQWVLTTSQAGQNFYIGNNPLNTTGSYIVPPSIRPDPRYEEMDFRAEAERRTGRKLTAGEVSDWWWQESFRHMRSDPYFASMMMLRKLLVFWNDYEIPDNLNMYLLERWSWVMRLPLPGFGALAAFAFLGAIVSWQRRTEVRALVAFTAVYCASVVAFFVFSRYRIQVVPVLAVLAAHGSLWLASQAAARRWDSAAGGVAAVVLAGWFCLSSHEWNDHDRAIAISLNNLAALYIEMGRQDDAIRCYEEAVALSPEGVVGAIRALGDHYLKAGDLGKAEGYMRQVVTIKPESRMGWNALVQLYTTKRARGEGGEDLTDRLAEALLGAGRADEARRVVAEARAAGHEPDAALAQRLGLAR